MELRQVVSEHTHTRPGHDRSSRIAHIFRKGQEFGSRYKPIVPNGGWLRYTVLIEGHTSSKNIQDALKAVLPQYLYQPCYHPADASRLPMTPDETRNSS